MKKILGLGIFLMILSAGCVLYVPQGQYGSPDVTPPPEEQQNDQWDYSGPDVSDYYAYLGPSGLWVSYPSYGYVWVPRDIGYNWRPYFLGHWIWTDYGWTWMSSERWGWLVYHYGRWGWDRRLGWYWVPGTVWGPSWVAWRWGEAYIGWAPLPPGDDFVPGYGFRRRDFNIPGHYWNFVRGHEFMDPRLDRWIIPPERNVTIINYTHIDVNIQVRNNRVINEGVGVDLVRRQTNQVVERHELRDARRVSEERVEAKDVVLYRPDIRRSETARPKEALDPEQAATRTAPGQTSNRYLGRTPQEREVAIRQAHDQERRRLEQDQQAEMKELQQKSNAARVSLRSPAERQKAEAEAKARLAEAQKKHENEKAQMAERHKQEEERARKNPPPKKVSEKH